MTFKEFLERFDLNPNSDKLFYDVDKVSRLKCRGYLINNFRILDNETRESIINDAITLLKTKAMEGTLYSSDERISTYLVEICTNLAKTEIRQLKKREEELFENMAKEFETIFQDEDTIDIEKLLEDIAKARQEKLNEKENIILDHVYGVNKKSMKEIGLMINMTEDVVKSTKYKAMNKLRNLFNKKK